MTTAKSSYKASKQSNNANGIVTFSKDNFDALCDDLSGRDNDLRNIIVQYGYPPLWKREASFETLVHIILEQQVSLASAKAAMDKLKQKIGRITPGKLAGLNDEEMKACYFSRQKTKYARHLSQEVLNKRLSISNLQRMNNDAVKSTLTKIKGIGNWTADVFMMMALNRTDCFPTGDIALIKSIRKVKHLTLACSQQEALAIADQWKPYRTIAAYLLWHHYLSERKKS